MTYGYVYVAQVAMGANLNQTIKAITEAEAYPGPSLIIGYTPVRDALHQGRHDQLPDRDEEGRRLRLLEPAALQPRAALRARSSSSTRRIRPRASYQNFLMNEARYSRLTREFPERAEELFAENEQAAMARWSHLQKLKDTLRRRVGARGQIASPEGSRPLRRLPFSTLTSW